MFTPHQSAWFAHWLTQTGRMENQVSRTMASARVDMNPHQVEAARFALQSPLSKGVLLADEVGLGKTIEAGLVLAQKWAERKRQLLLIVPASLRKQWEQELQDKFELPSKIIDGKVADKLKKQGQSNPFAVDERIVICSYEFIAKRKEWAKLIDWHVVVFDEAHKLRNIYKSGSNKRAKAIVEAVERAESRILLSATPIQNNLMELYGLASVIDEHYFGDQKSFRNLYTNRRKDMSRLDDLKQRIQPLCYRTLRRQVQQEGGINFTNRYAITEDFTPGDEEWALYQKLSDYLRTPEIAAIDPKAIHLVSIGMRKTLASSSFAIADTLKGMVERLQQQQLLDEDSLVDLEEMSDWYDQFDPIDAAVARSDRRNQLQLEIDLLQQCQNMAREIKINAKGEALLRTLGKAMDMTENVGGQHKAVVFTESCRTQQYLHTLLSEQGYQGRVVLLNGSNSDSESKQIYQQWLQHNSGSARVSGSKTADMKAAIVDRFRSEAADILISTEAGGEGINLQFCSILVNYDLPWNPQKVEQRIGRVHRYGQKNDVVVVNFVNRKNPADQRVFELLDQKFKLFEGVFGASDEILGAIAGGEIDIEKRIYQIYQKCRTDEEIEYQFDQLQQDMEELLCVREEAARQTLLDNFDRDVVAALKTRRDQSDDFLRGYEKVLLDLAAAELPEVKLERNHFFLDGVRYDLKWSLAEHNHSEFFRLQATEHYLAWDLVRQAKERSLRPAQISFYYSRMQGHLSDLKPLIGQSGLLQAITLQFSYANTRESYAIAIAQTDHGKMLSPEQAERLLSVPADEQQASMTIIDEVSLKPLLQQLLQQKKVETEAQLEQWFDQENDKLERWAEDRRKALMQDVEELDGEIRTHKKESRQLASTAEKIQAKKALRRLERKRDSALTEYHQAKKSIEQQEDKLLDDVSAKLELKMEVTPLFVIAWTLNP
ncbi:MAG: DEAD/DEAH box helicase [Gammaproteobacteria bacterium]|nr:DEAD/DEAH box helicase [Gammaproteobacteria bacterium]MBT3488829.1 DEAD/DEAH box helicase [Gammaproteobacteria bacterium]MBT3718796.1 DEAD/DEAH box helicase [Gammaproteobacteria bacterium]MBT3845890.1 DEAD/DEAH box helicase [Gammaproteobacteria bacterium]MBT3894263.1 DEAD/DEAH box helicase [Gammaproteobacteria bacterium]